MKDISPSSEQKTQQGADLWEDGIGNNLQVLADKQEYERLWDYILKNEEGDPIVKAHAVWLESTVVLILTWDPYYWGAIGSKSTPSGLPSYLDGSESRVRVYAVGTVIAFTSPSRQDSPNNWAHTIFEPEGKQHLMEAFSEAWMRALSCMWPLRSDDPENGVPAVDEGLEFLRKSKRRTAGDKHQEKNSQGLSATLSDDWNKPEHAGYRGLAPAPLPTTITRYVTRSARRAGNQLFQETKRPFVDVPLDIALQIVEYLATTELRTFALANSTCNRVANRRLWRYFYLAWSEDEDESLLDMKFLAITRNPPRTACIRSLAIVCGWSWNEQRIALFTKALSFMTNLEDLTLLEPPRLEASTIKGGDYSPILPFLISASQPSLNKDEHARDPLHLKRFHTSLLLRNLSADILQFLQTQPQLKNLSGTLVHPNCLLSIPPDVLPKLEILETPDIPTAAAWLQSRPVKHLKIQSIHECSPFSSLKKALETMSSPLEVLHMALNTCSCHYKMAGPYIPDLLEGLAEINSPIQSLILPWYRMQRKTRDQSEELEYISNLSRLRYLEIGGFRPVDRYGGGNLANLDDRRPHLWLEGLPANVEKVMMANTLYTRQVKKGGQIGWVKTAPA
ncbi:hypothetical protein DL93DRAFT_2164713 [Clavulina sp. PMI_390]|nr:hypothetical protein DL93DRAFT_2164713 [Clavulina sp. PMI_390]